MQTLFLTGRLFSSTRTFLMLGRQIFLVFLFEWLTLFPIWIALPHTSHFAITFPFQIVSYGVFRARRRPRYTVWHDTIILAPVFFNYFIDYKRVFIYFSADPTTRADGVHCRFGEILRHVPAAFPSLLLHERNMTAA